MTGDEAYAMALDLASTHAKRVPECPPRLQWPWQIHCGPPLASIDAAAFDDPDSGSAGAIAVDKSVI